jgi:hypothetical protein
VEYIQKVYIFKLPNFSLYKTKKVVYMAKTIGKNTGSSIRMIALVTVALMALSIPASACTYSLGDRVWEDKDKDGIQESGEVGLPNVKVELFKEDRSHNLQLIGNTITNQNGNYQFNNLAAGNYYVKFTPIKGYVFSPQDVGTYTIDSDADVQTGMTKKISLCSNICTVDAGMYYVENTEIPEYPTVALPVAAILGLAFVFMRKQE